MKFDKYFVRIIDDNVTAIVSREELLDLILDSKRQPMRLTPIDCDGNLVHSLSFLIGDDYSLSFMFNTKDF